MDNSKVTTIDKNKSFATMINVFKVEPEKQQELVDVLSEATEEVMKQQPGFVSANIHKSLDGVSVVNYVQWRSMQDFEAMRSNPEARVHMDKAAALAQYELHFYEVAFIGHGQ